MKSLFLVLAFAILCFPPPRPIFADNIIQANIQNDIQNDTQDHIPNKKQDKEGTSDGLPFGVFDSPKNGATVSSSILLSGWALDDSSVETVKLYYQTPRGPVYIGTAIFSDGARPDVEKDFPNYPNASRAGWGYMLLSYFLPNGGNGTFTFIAIATDDQGNFATLGTTTVTIDNINTVKPFGAIDTPKPGETISGKNYPVFGWALTPPPNRIPGDGSTINVVIDNAIFVGQPDYGLPRPDIARLFPDYVNSSAAGGLFYFDTTAFSNGIHQIAWTVRDNAGNIDGIGSRYITIDNSGLSTRRLTVQSSPDTGVSITVSPADNNGNGSGTTNFTRIYDTATAVTVTAPQTDNGKNFSKWTIDGADNSNESISVTMSADHTLCAYYTADTGETALSALWANNGEDKVTRDELRATVSASSVTNSLWNGEKISVFGAKNEIVAFNLILETETGATNVSLQLDSLTGPGNAVIGSIPADGDHIFDWTQRNIELFYLRYLQIKGLSRLTWESYDERHVPQRFRRPWTGNGEASGGWTDRPDHDKFYPEIAVPIELVQSFNIAANSNQGIWVDIYIPKNATAGLYSGNITVKEGGVATNVIPVELTVRNFTLPDTPNAKTMLYIEYEDINKRYIGTAWPDAASDVALSKLVRDRHFLLAHRHRVSLIGDIEDSSMDKPHDDWLSRLSGALFTAANGYAGPGVNTPNDIYSIGTYGSWDWQGEGEASMRSHTNNWVDWFEQNASGVDYFLYLIDESDNFQEIQQWAQWINNNPGSGQRMKSMATLPVPEALANTPALDIPTSWADIGITATWENAASTVINDSSKRFYMYNSNRPACGTFATEDDGVSLRVLAWTHYKKNVDRWFYWSGTYYNNYQGDMGETNVFTTAHTFGSKDSVDAVFGETGWNYTNGDGVLFYPGTDKLFPSVSYNVDFPFASLRLKHWRRGIQDIDYLVMAAQVDSQRVQTLVNTMIPKVLWEYGVDDPNDPTYVTTDISWSVAPDDWEAAREALADIIEGK